MIGQEFEVWICPKCGNLYASSDVQGLDLTAEFNTDIKNQPTFARSRCPNCKQIHRVRCIAKVIRRWETPMPTMTEAQYWESVLEIRRTTRRNVEGTSHQDLPVRSGPLPSEP